ncbi:hypothetical protein Tco_0604211 [Tanacetum coccineum]
MNEGASVIDLVNKFNSLISRLVSVGYVIIIFVAHVLGRHCYIKDRNSVRHIAEEAKQMHVEIMEERRGVEQAECYGFGSIIPCYLVHGSVTKVQAKTKYGRLVDEKTLEVVGVGDVVLKTTLGTSMTSKWNVSEGSLVVTLRKKCGSLYMVEVHPDGIDALIDSSGTRGLVI